MLTFSQGDIKVVNENFDAGDIFYSDLPREEQLKWMSCCTKHPKACSFYAPKTMPRNEIDSTFFYTEYDQAFPVDMQRAMVGQLKAGGVQIGEVSLKSSHSPMLSMPDVLAEKILEVI